MVAEITMKFGDSEVLYDAHHQTWTVEGVSEAIMLKIAPDKVFAINAALVKEVAEYQERIAKEEAEKEALRLSKRALEIRRALEISTFRLSVEPLLPNGFTARYASLDRAYDDPQSVNISKAGLAENVYIESANVAFDDKKKGSFYSHATSFPWRVNFDLKNTRHTTLAKAVLAACRKIDEKVAENARKVAAKEVKQKKVQDERHILANHGIDLIVETQYYQGAKGRRTDSYEIKKARIVVLNPTPEDNGKKVVVSGNLLQDNTIAHVTIVGNFTIEQFKKLADAVKEIAPETSSAY